MQVAEYHQFVPNTNSIPVLEKRFCEGCSSVTIISVLIHRDCHTPSAATPSRSLKPWERPAHNKWMAEKHRIASNYAHQLGCFCLNPFLAEGKAAPSHSSLHFQNA